MSHVWKRKTYSCWKPLLRKAPRKRVREKNIIWLKKQFSHHIEYAGFQDFDLKFLVGFEISPTCFYLTKRGLIRKSNKPELTTELKSMITKKYSNTFAASKSSRHQIISNVIIDFMAYARKVLIKKPNLKTYNTFFISLWSTSSFLFKSCNQVDIIFDVYKENSIKASEQRWRTTVEGINKNNCFSFWSTFIRWNWSILVCFNNSSQSGYQTRLKWTIW